MPLDLLVKKIKNRPDLAEKADKFVYSSVHVIGIGFDGVLPSRLQKKCWMYFPESHIPPYRVTVFSNYSPNNVPEPDKQWSLLCEVSESPDKPVNADTIAEEVRQALTEAGLIPENEQVVSLWHKRLEHGYPTPFIGRDELLEGIQSQLESMNIFSRGRFGGWKYEVSNQDHSLMQGKEVVDRLLNGEEEMTYLHPDVVNSRKN
jgi:protoporphyrinogen oxidase